MIELRIKAGQVGTADAVTDEGEPTKALVILDPQSGIMVTAQIGEDVCRELAAQLTSGLYVPPPPGPVGSVTEGGVVLPIKRNGGGAA